MSLRKKIAQNVVQKFHGKKWPNNFDFFCHSKKCPKWTIAQSAKIRPIWSPWSSSSVIRETRDSWSPLDENPGIRDPKRSNLHSAQSLNPVLGNQGDRIASWAGLPDISWYNVPKRENIPSYQKYTKCAYFQMAVK
jgi:hypothetical protein